MIYYFKIWLSISKKSHLSSVKLISPLTFSETVAVYSGILKKFF
jgi:hypothetical protein